MIAKDLDLKLSNALNLSFLLLVSINFDLVNITNFIREFQCGR